MARKRIFVLKKTTVLFLFCFCIGHASSIKSKLIENIIKNLFLNTKISLFVQDKTYISSNTPSEVFDKVDDCTNANLIIIKSIDSISEQCLKKARYIIVTSYNSYQNDEEALGAIFWQKGRLNLIFRKEKLKELGLSLPSNYNRYIE